MPSSGNRKKNKGRERKAKKEESKKVELYNLWKNQARGKSAKGDVIVQCDHGLDTRVPDISHPVSSFISDYLVCDNIRDTLQTHEEVWNNVDYRKLARDTLIRIVATHLLDNTVFIIAQDEHFDGVGLAWGITIAILVLENYDETVSSSVDGNYHSARYNRMVASTNRDVGVSDISNKRDVLKFYRKRMNCKCLKKKHLEARKSMPKVGACHHCKVEKERRLLMVCSRCMIDQYCSRECQVAASVNHREDCDKYVEAHEHALANISK